MVRRHRSRGESHRSIIIRRRPGKSRGELQLHEGGRITHRFPVVVGGEKTPTPTGKFVIDEVNRKPHYRNPRTREVTPYSMRCPLWPTLVVFRDEMGRRLKESMHGTTEAGFRKGAESHGCIRLRRADMLDLTRHLSEGMEVEIKD